jgi:hypothetical protein
MTSYNIALLAGIYYLSIEWEDHREELYKYACSQTYDDRWQMEWFRNHMYDNYINVDRPITSRFYSLDDGNLILVIRFVQEVLMRGTAERKVYF